MLRIELPLPPKELSPNARVHWSVRARATREAIDQVFAAVLEQGGKPRSFDHATVTMTFVVPNKRRRDKQNLIGASKAYIDGLVGTVIKDDNWQSIEEIYPPIVYEKGKSMTIIEVQSCS